MGSSSLSLSSSFDRFAFVKVIRLKLVFLFHSVIVQFFFCSFEISTRMKFHYRNFIHLSKFRTCRFGIVLIKNRKGYKIVKEHEE